MHMEDYLLIKILIFRVDSDVFTSCWFC